jgi:hypothetical protein
MTLMRVNIPVLLLAMLLAMALPCPTLAAGPVPGVSADASNHQGDFAPANLVDGDPSTAWVGGGKGVGPGKSIELVFPAPVRLEGMTVATGHQDRFDAFRRMTRGVIVYPDGTRQKFTLKPQPGAQRIALKPKVADSLKIVITGVAPAMGDKTMGDAKVAVSEITVFGEVDESLATATETGGEEPPDARPQPAKEARPAKKPEAAEKAAKPAPEPKAKPAPKAKAEPAPKPKAKAAPKPAPKSESKPESKPAPKKPAPKKTAKKSASKKGAPEKKSPGKSPGTITRLRPAVEISPDKELAVGVISPWLDLELVAEIKRYLGLLTTLHDSYPELFVPAIRERERAAFLKLQESMRAKHEFGGHHIAMLEHIGLNFDKPVIQGDKAMVRVHGPYRYYIENKACEFRVDADVTLVRVNGRWLIEDVRDR